MLTNSKGILTLSSWSQKGINWSAQKFIQNTKPAEKDVELSKNAKAGFRMVHNASVKTVTVSKSTTGAINKVGVSLYASLIPYVPC